MIICRFCNLVQANFVHDGIVLCLSHLMVSLKWRLFLKVSQLEIKSYT